MFVIIDSPQCNGSKRADELYAKVSQCAGGRCARAFAATECRSALRMLKLHEISVSRWNSSSLWPASQLSEISHRVSKDHSKSYEENNSNNWIKLWKNFTSFQLCSFPKLLVLPSAESWNDLINFLMWEKVFVMTIQKHNFSVSLYN